ncbi:hypothetical protein [Variovorax sp. LT1R16]|uniref:hypothetical protein n=1 Tax=Variovorax sp. LT1R16 TaxID=3443728 RepID=UPI003F496163
MTNSVGDEMNVNAHDEAEWHAATDRYAEALQKMTAGDLGAREALQAAYRQLSVLRLHRPSLPLRCPVSKPVAFGIRL